MICTNIEHVKEWAIAAHESIGQKRKYGGQPYWHHPVAVAEELKKNGRPEVEQAAALLHDVLEDVGGNACHKFNADAMLAFVGKEITDIVCELTNRYSEESYPDLSYEERKCLELEFKIKRFSQPACWVKMADIRDNCLGLATLAPDFAKKYVAKCLVVLEALPIKSGTEASAYRIHLHYQLWKELEKLGLKIPAYEGEE